MQKETQQPEGMLEGKNAVWEALKAEKPIEKILLAKTIQQESVRGITGLARARKIKVEFVPKERLDSLSATGRHQGVIALSAAQEYAVFEDTLAAIAASGKVPLVVLLDEVQDPHNLGAIVRTAECAGAQAVIIPQHNSAGLTPAAGRASAGAVAHVPVCRVVNLVAAMERLKELGYWVVGADMEGTLAYEVDFTGPIALVVGGEDKGLRRLTRENCDHIARLPMLGQLNSLNASVAAGVLLYEVVRQRTAAGR